MKIPLLAALVLATAACSSQAQSSPAERPREVRIPEGRLNLNALLTEGRIHNNKDGCQLTNLEEGGIYAKLGIFEGDTVSKLDDESGVVDCLHYFSAIDKKSLKRVYGRDSAGNPFELEYRY